MKPRKNLSIYVLLVGVLGLLIVGGIFAFQLLDESTKNQLPTIQRELVKPIDGKLETSVIENLSKRKIFSREEIVKVPAIQVEVQKPVLVSSSSATATSSGTASASATINETIK